MKRILLISIVSLLSLALFFGCASQEPTVTQTATGNHYYSPFTGQYSFDYPNGWEIYFMSVNSTMYTESQFKGAVFLKNNNNSSIVLNFNNIPDFRVIYDCPIPGGSVNSSERVTWGKIDGCLMRNLTTPSGKKAELDFVAPKCQDSDYVISVIGTGTDEKAMKEIISTLRCGADATK